MWLLKMFLNVRVISDQSIANVSSSNIEKITRTTHSVSVVCLLDKKQRQRGEIEREREWERERKREREKERKRDK